MTVGIAVGLAWGSGTAHAAFSLTPSFGSPFTAGDNTIAVAAADFNGDGRLDLTTANFDANTVGALLGDGTGGFMQASGGPVAVAGGPRALAAGRFNGDARPDLIVVSLSNTATVLLGNGAGGFAPAAGGPIPVGAGPRAVAVSDFNGDGKQDFATANRDASNVSVLLGDGAGGFASAPGSPAAVGAGPFALAAGDFDKNGIPDLSVTMSAQPAPRSSSEPVRAASYPRPVGRSRPASTHPPSPLPTSTATRSPISRPATSAPAMSRSRWATAPAASRRRPVGPPPSTARVRPWSATSTVTTDPTWR